VQPLCLFIPWLETHLFPGTTADKGAVKHVIPQQSGQGCILRQHIPIVEVVMLAECQAKM
jgi:hypothetical protein